MPLPGQEAKRRRGLNWTPDVGQIPANITLYELRYQDLAMAATAHLSKRDDFQKLFPRALPHPIHVYRVETLAMPQGDDVARQNVLDAIKP